MRMIFMGILIFCCGKSSCLLIIDPHTHMSYRQICIDACIDIMQVALDWTYEHASKFSQTYLTYRGSVHTILRIANTFVQLLFWYSVRQKTDRNRYVLSRKMKLRRRWRKKGQSWCGVRHKNLVTWENQPQRLTGIVPWWCRVVSGDYGKPRFRVSSGCRSIVLAAGGGFKHVFIFTPKIGEAEPILTSIFFNWVETTN